MVASFKYLCRSKKMTNRTVKEETKETTKKYKKMLPVSLVCSGNGKCIGKGKFACFKSYYKLISIL
jgi:hypothetical protein